MFLLHNARYDVYHSELNTSTLTEAWLHDDGDSASPRTGKKKKEKKRCGKHKGGSSVPDKPKGKDLWKKACKLCAVCACVPAVCVHVCMCSRDYSHSCVCRDVICLQEHRDKASAREEKARVRQQAALDAKEQSDAMLSSRDVASSSGDGLVARPPPSPQRVHISPVVSPTKADTAPPSLTLRPIWYCGFQVLPDPGWRETVARCTAEVTALGRRGYGKKPRIPVRHSMLSVFGLADGTLGVLSALANISIYRPDDVWSWAALHMCWLRKPAGDMGSRATAATIVRGNMFMLHVHIAPTCCSCALNAPFRCRSRHGVAVRVNNIASKGSPRTCRMRYSIAYH